jgi:DNA-binding CsgD family transcriptional regulator/tetratricopeptide (TPR) repeat protein
MGAPYPLALTLLGLGRVALDQGDVETARRHLDEALAVARPAHLGHLEAAALDGLGEAALALDELQPAQKLFERARHVAEKCGDKTGGARAIYRLADLSRTDGDLHEAAKLQHEALRQYHALGVRQGVADALEAIARLDAQRGDIERAARLFGATEAARQAGGWVRTSRRHDSYTGELGRLMERSAPEALEAMWAQGTALGVENAVKYAVRGRGQRSRGSTGPAALTATEREVVRLVAEGLDNAEIAGRLVVSPRTVQSHLRRVYPKLGVASRRELRKALGDTRKST